MISDDPVEIERTAQTLGLHLDGAKTPQRLYAEAALDGVTVNAMTAQQFALHQLPQLDMTEAVLVLKKRTKAVHDGDLQQAESMLLGQAVALESIFTELARRANGHIGGNLETVERYLRLALKAQGQCRATLETLIQAKNPPMVIAKQANFAQGPQQVNNSSASEGEPYVAPRARARKKIPSVTNELLAGAGHGSETLDTRAARATTRSHPTMEAVDSVNRTGQRRGQKKGRA